MHKVYLMGLLAVTASSLAGGSVTGKVTEMQAEVNKPAVRFTVNAEINDTPKCNETNSLTVNLSKPGGTAMLRLVILAKEHAYTIEVTGLGTCSANWNSEDVKEIFIR